MILGFFSKKDKTTKLERLYVNYNKLMYKIAYGILEDHQLTEDAIQASFVRVQMNLDKTDENDVAKTRSYLATICRNVALDIYKKQHKSSSFGDFEEVISTEDTDFIYNPLDIVIEKETNQRVKKAIMELELIYRDVILFRHSRGMAFDKIAEQLGITEAAARKRYARAKDKIAQAIKKEESK